MRAVPRTTEQFYALQDLMEVAATAEASATGSNDTAQCFGSVANASMEAQVRTAGSATYRNLILLTK